jgi:hypothetical protein
LFTKKELKYKSTVNLWPHVFSEVPNLDQTELDLALSKPDSEVPFASRLFTETKVKSGTSQSKSETSIHLSSSESRGGDPQGVCEPLLRETEREKTKGHERKRDR